MSPLPNVPTNTNALASPPMNDPLSEPDFQFGRLLSSVHDLYKSIAVFVSSSPIEYDSIILDKPWTSIPSYATTFSKTTPILISLSSVANDSAS